MPKPALTQTSAVQFHGHFDGVEDGYVRGWAVCNSPRFSPVKLHVIIDGQEVAVVMATLPREDVQASLSLPTPEAGFSFELPAEYFDGTKHTLSLRFEDRSVLPLSSDGKVTSIIFAGHLKPSYKSYVDGVKQGALRGWVLREQRGKADEGGVVLSIIVDGVRIGQTRADRYRGDVASVLGCNPNCGFEFAIPQSLRGSGQHKIEVLALPDNVALEGCPIITSFADDAFESRIIDVTNELDDLYRRMAKLRQELRDLVPKRPYTLGDYDRWARKYYPLLEKRVAEQRMRDKGHPIEAPLVSILCPVYRPLASDFEAAVQSVLDQTYENWELILVDDAGKSRETTDIINGFVKRDNRVKSIVLKKNVGIAGATNVAMDAAKGQYVAFFDHDDMLVNVAIEVMVRAACETGAKLLYSDEDKIDQAGYYLEPNLKPDFNYRYLLGCNYICHLTMVETKTMRQIGHLSSDYDGAQDHDFVLRATEILKPSDIFHVPEVLYHWRKTPNSTAADVSQKTYAINAGVKCVADHLKRRKIASKVSSIRGLTLYGIDWTFRKQPSVDIIVPFKDQVDITRNCVENILAHTDYKNYTITLIDNWSVRDET
ncbi:glycosyltransferase, partial [Acetobacter sp.]|uniref:glycosyltransferase n=1 Tax=Acetobacter sp. TaxID=440 RepID=UPI0039E994AD